MSPTAVKVDSVTRESIDEEGGEAMKDLAATVRSMLISRRVDTRLIIFMAVFAVLMVVVPSWLALQDMRNTRTAEQVSSEAQRIVGQVEELAA